MCASVCPGWRTPVMGGGEQYGKNCTTATAHHAARNPRGTATRVGRAFGVVCVCALLYSVICTCVRACAPNCIDYTRRRKRIRFEAHLNNRLLYDAHPNVFICVGELTSLAGGG